MHTRSRDKLGLLGVINQDFSSVKVGNLREGFLREINGCLASGGRASINNLDGDAATLARLGYPCVCRTLASHPVHPPTCSTIGPEFIAPPPLSSHPDLGIHSMQMLQCCPINKHYIKDLTIYSGFLKI